MSAPKQRTQVLGCSSDCCHSACTAIITLSKVIFTLTKINHLDLVRLLQKQVRRFQIPMTDANTLQISQWADDWYNHLFELFLFPEYILLLSLAEHVLQILSWFHILTDHGDSECVVHSFVEVIAVKLKNIGMSLYFEKLYCFFLSFHKASNKLTLYSFNFSRVFASTSLIA